MIHENNENNNNNKRKEIDMSMYWAIELFVSHYKVADDWKSSTVLVDASKRIVAFFDRGTDTVQVVQNSGLNYFWKYMYAFFSWTKSIAMEANVVLDREHFGVLYLTNIIKDYGEKNWWENDKEN